MKKLIIATLAISCVLTHGETAMAWGHQGHAVIDQTAVMSLSGDGPEFLKDYVDYIADNATQPDSWRSTSEPFSKISEDPNHGWFRQQFEFMEVIPRSRYEFILALHDENRRLMQTDPEAAQRMNIRWTGTLPYAVMETYGHLVSCMRQVRRLRDEGADATNMEQTCAFHVAWLGHYVGDGAQPMHVSWHSDGWRGPNPNNYERGSEIHGRFESHFVEAIDLRMQDIAERIGAPARQNGDLFTHVLDFVDGSGQHAEAIFQMDKRGAFDDPKDVEAREFTYAHTANGARFLRDLVLRAWKQSAMPRQDLLNPNEATRPEYNSETGSAPAP